MKVIFMNGQSNRHCCELSPAQERISQRLIKEGIEVAPLNFPYNTQLAPYQPCNLLSASLSNSFQFLFSRTLYFRRQFRGSVLKQFQQEDSYLVLAGSCGLELLNNLNLPAAVLKKTQVFSYGPVARQLPKAKVITVQGTKDWLSKCFFKQVDYQVNCGHMNYLECPEVINLLLEKIHLITLREGADEAKKD